MVVFNEFYLAFHVGHLYNIDLYVVIHSPQPDPNTATK